MACVGMCLVNAAHSLIMLLLGELGGDFVKGVPLMY